MESKFDGGVLANIGTNIVVLLITILTLGIATPWAVCYKQRWIIKHTVIEGKRLKFIGTGGGLFVKYIIWFLLTIITLGIYSFWLTIKLQQWLVSHTVFEDSAAA